MITINPAIDIMYPIIEHLHISSVIKDIVSGIMNTSTGFEYVVFLLLNIMFL